MIFYTVIVIKIFLWNIKSRNLVKSGSISGVKDKAITDKESQQ